MDTLCDETWRTINCIFHRLLVILVKIPYGLLYKDPKLHLIMERHAPRPKDWPRPRGKDGGRRLQEEERLLRSSVAELCDVVSRDS